MSGLKEIQKDKERLKLKISNLLKEFTDKYPESFLELEAESFIQTTYHGSSAFYTGKNREEKTLTKVEIKLSI
jgi:hypothetical protein